MRLKDKTDDKFIIGMVTGILLLAISVIMWALLGKNIVVTYHDQLDGEVLCYLYRAKYLGQGCVIPELFNGMAKSAMTPPAPFCVLYYKLFSPFFAFFLCQYEAMLVGFLGMYLFLYKAKVHPFIACFCGTLFAYLPLLPVYGLSMLGVPLEAWVFWNLLEEGMSFKKKILLFIMLILLAGNSSLVLSGFAILMAVFFTGLFWKKSRTNKNYWMGFVVLTMTYLLINWDLVEQVLGLGDPFVSHREEFVLQGVPFWDSFINYLMNGSVHANSQQKWIFLFSIFVLGLGMIKKEWKNEFWKNMRGLVTIAIGIALFCAFYDGIMMVEFRKQIGGVAVWFQMNRIHWLYPAIWYLVLAFEIQWVLKICAPSFLKWIFCTMAAVTFILTTFLVFDESTWKINLKNLLMSRSEGISWKEFYAEDVMCQVEDFLKEKTGKQMKDYRVVSLGICPAAPLYHGFYCLDGYSNNYDLEYKHKFQRIIQPELEKSSYLSEYFENWGNRCYLVSAETPGYFTVEKGGFYYADYEMDVEAFKDLGGDFLLSAAYIENAEQTGLYLMREKPFVTEDSYYHIYLYGVKE